MAVAKGQRGRGAAGKAPVFGLLKRGGRVYTKVIPDASGATQAPLVERKGAPDSMVYTDSWKGYNALDVSSLRYLRVNHSELFADEYFWNQAKRHMRKFNGVPRVHFKLFLKDCEWRFNSRKPETQLHQIKQWVKLHCI